MKFRWPLLPILFFSQALKAQPSSFEDIQAAVGDYRYGQALELLEDLPDSLRNSYGYYQLAAVVYRNTGQADRALHSYQEAMSADSVALAPLILSAQIEQSRQNYSEALGWYQKALNRDTNNAYIYRQLARLYLQNREPARSIACLQKVLELEVENKEARVQLIKLYIDQQVYERADTMSREAIKEDPSQQQFWQLACLSAFRQKAYASTWKYGQGAFRNGADSTKALMRIVGVAAYHRNSLDTAHLLLVKALLAGDESENVFFYLGQIAQAQEFPARAEAYFRQAIKAGMSEALGVYELHLAFSLDDQEKYAEAIPFYQQAYAKNPSVVILYYLARDYDEAYRDKTLAIRYYQRFLNESNNSYYEYSQYAKERISELKRIQHFRDGALSPEPETP